jgi:hypothetical protein
MNRFRTLRVRFAVWTAVFLLVTLSVSGVFEYLTLSSSLYRSEDDLLRLSATQVMGVVTFNNGEIATSDDISDSLATVESRERGISIKILNLDGQIVQSTGTYAFKQPIDINLISNGSYFNTFSDPATGIPVRIFYSPLLQNDRVVGSYSSRTVWSVFRRF